MNRTKSIYAAILAILCATTILLTGCDGGSSSNSQEVDQLRSENSKLHAQNDALRNDNANLKHREGYLVMTVGMATLCAGVLFCVGLAVGIGIRKSIKQHGS